MATRRDFAWILGDSHIFWLEKFVGATEVHYSVSLLECMDCAITFHGYRGGTAASLEGNSGLRRKLANAIPNVVVLSVGGNDLDNAGTPQTLKVGIRLYQYAQALVTMGVNRVVACQIVCRQRWRHISYEEGTAKVAEVFLSVTISIYRSGGILGFGISNDRYSVPMGFTLAIWGITSCSAASKGRCLVLGNWCINITK